MVQIGQTPATIDTPIEHLMACHRRIEDRLSTLERAGDSLRDHAEEGRNEEAGDAITACFRFLDSSGVLHTLDEEESLFPRLRPLLSADELAYVDALEGQHRESEKVYEELRAAAASGDVSAYRKLAAQLAGIYRAHIQSEDEILTKLARRSLTESALEAISTEMKERRISPRA